MSRQPCDLLTLGRIFAMLPAMFQLTRKFLAILLAVWLPLFSGYALADSIVMQNMRGDCYGEQQIAHSAQHDTAIHDSASHQHMHHVQLAGSEAQSHDNQEPACDNCGVCQLACSGYFAVTVVDMAAIEPSSQAYTLSSTEFQSVTVTPLDPPPLARV
jgi:hypothetical protein